MTVLCRELHTLPRAGGLKDQDSRDIWLIRHTIGFIKEREELDKQRNKPK